MLKTTPAGEPLAVMTAGGTEVSVELESVAPVDGDRASPCREIGERGGGVGVGDRGDECADERRSLDGLNDAPCELSGASATVIVTPAAP